jgi:uncharacterized protein with NAD-binding domain and iron-sulfur cluster
MVERVIPEPDSDANAPEKIAILGGGIGALASAFELARQNPADGTPKYDITIYQMGWRLGGKLATGRNMEKGARIEEHGIHGFMGSYYNACGMMSEVYKLLANIPGLTGYYQKFEDAFIKQGAVVMWEQRKSGWAPWMMALPDNDLSYDNLSELSGIHRWLRTFLNLLGMHLRDSGIESMQSAAGAIDTLVADKDEESLMAAIEAWLAEGLDDIWQLVKPTLEAVDELTHDEKHLHSLILIDFSMALLTGFFADDIQNKGFHSIDHENYSDWLRRHGASKITLNSPFTLNTPDITYNFPGGDTSQPPQMAAGSFLQWTLRLYGYIGAFVQAFRAGSGETVLAPLYRALKEMGVKFEFFHKVEKLHPGEGSERIERVDIAVQATTLDGGEYDPLIGPVKNLMCWPTKPRYELLEQGEALKAQEINLESWWSPWQNVRQKTLRAGVDYDHLVLGISLGALPYICEDLIAAQPNWQSMVTEIETVQTQAMQLWFNEPVKGYLNQSVTIPAGNAWIAGTYEIPIQGQADFSDLLPVEDWPVDGPKGLFYLCGPKLDSGIPAFTDHDYPKQQYALVKENCESYLTEYSAAMLPGASDGASLKFDLLYNPTTDAPFDYQFWRANIDPTERYVTSFPNKIQYRLKAWESGYKNLALAGDWIDTGLNVGSVEGAVMGGKLASHAISTEPTLAKIYGYDPFG